ncbi:MAG: acetylornithine deacetylase [Proteobacteria bacterium]|nr:acetylornithine deacetylase [Pseudomonadota bacterium]
MSATPSPVDLTRTLVSFDTTSAKSNLALIDHVEAYFADLGVSCDRSWDEDKAKANLFATIGPPVAGGVVLSGHTDVVPVAGQDWDSDPFTLTERDGRLFGRGAADMKTFLGAALAMAPRFAAAELRRPVHYALSYDEEVGCLGVRRMLPVLRDRGLAPAAVIVGEPTNMEVVTSHKGVRAFRTTVTGSEAHSSAPHLGANAILVANKLLGFLRALARELANDAAPGDADPPYPTINVGMIQGGSAINIVPRTCTFHWEYRPLPGTDPDEIHRRFTAFVEQEYREVLRADGIAATIETEPLASIPALAQQQGSAAATLALQLAGKNRVRHVSYGSEAGLFREAGFDAVLCGPGDIADAHRPNESISLEQVAACETFLHRLSAHLCDPPE